LDCGTSNWQNNVLLALSRFDNGNAYALISNSESKEIYANSSLLKTGDWHHLALTLKGNIGTLFINGSVWVQGNLGKPTTVNRTRCYLGRSNWWKQLDPANVFATFDDMKIHNRSLNQSEVLQLISEYMDSSTNENIIDPFSNSLTHYWPFNSNLKDIIGGKDLISNLFILQKILIKFPKYVTIHHIIRFT
jgi:hypothetical protein